MTDTPRTAAPTTEAGRRLLGVAYLAGDAASEGVNLLDAILAIEAEARAASQEREGDDGLLGPTVYYPPRAASQERPQPDEEVVYEEGGEQVIIRRAASQERPQPECGYECPYTEEGHEAMEVDHPFVASQERPSIDVERLQEAIRLTTLDHYSPNAPASYAGRVAKHYAALSGPSPSRSDET